MKVEVFSSPDTAAGEAARIVAARAREAIAARGIFLAAFSGGHTPWLMLRALANEDVPWDKIHIFQVDERVAPAGDPDRNLTLRDSLLEHAPIPPGNVHAMPVEEPDLRTAAAQYAHTLPSLAGSPPVLDLVHLGLGTDGHTASLVPGDAVLDTQNADVAVTGPYQGHPRMSFTYPILNRSGRILWLVTGGDKAGMLLRLCNGDPSIPAGRVSQDAALILADRFLLSNGHASMLLWSVLHLTGTRAVNAKYERLGQPSVTLDDIRHFRQLDSKAPGHPEYHWTSGVEATTGPLGQGVATSMGMAIAEKWLAAKYNRPGFDIFDYRIYVICGDGDMMEGVASEAASLAGHLQLDNLCWIYDNNHITIEGKTRITFTEDIACRFLAYGWNVLRVGDANDTGLIENALETFRKTKGRPTFIVLDSHIGYGSPHKHDTAEAHGEPLGEEEVRLTKRFYGWPEDAKFLVPDAVYKHFADGVGARGAKARMKWTDLFAAYQSKYPALATEIDLMQRRELPEGWDRNLPVFPASPKGIAGWDASGEVLNVLAQNIPWLVGGSADLGTSATFRERATGETRTCPLRHLFLFIGADPNASWLSGCVAVDGKGFVITGANGSGGALPLETSRPGVFAIGDVRAGSTKRVAAAVGEGAAVVAQIHSILAAA